jgi:hypothetical protein
VKAKVCVHVEDGTVSYSCESGDGEFCRRVDAIMDSVITLITELQKLVAGWGRSGGHD